MDRIGVRIEIPQSTWLADKQSLTSFAVKEVVVCYGPGSTLDWKEINQKIQVKVPNS